MIEHYSHKIQNAIQKELFKANKSIKIAVAWFTNDLLFQPLLLKLASGVSIEIILNKDEINCSDENEIDFDEFVNAGGVLRWNDTKQLLHDKFCIIDDMIVIYGSYNWTNKAEYNEESIAIARNEENTVNFYLDKFSNLSHKYPKEKATKINSTPVIKEDEQETLIEKSPSEPSKEDDLYYVDSSGAIYSKDFSILYKGADIKEFKIDRHTREIKENAFLGFKKLEKINLAILERIGDNAFKDCESLKEVTFLFKCEFGKNVFMNCISLYKISSTDGYQYGIYGNSLFPSTKKVTCGMFMGCVSLESFNFRDIEIVEDSAFEGCRNLKKIDFPDFTKSIGQRAFYGCHSLKEIVLPRDLRVLGKDSLANCRKLEQIKMDYLSFLNKTPIKSIIGDNTPLSKIIVTGGLTIPSNSFERCTTLKEVIFQAESSLWGIGDYAFRDCTQLEKIEYECGFVDTSIGDYAFQNCISLKKLPITEGFAYIGKYAFKDCTSIREIFIPKSVEVIEEGAFQGCDNLLSIKVDPSNKFYDSRNDSNTLIKTDTNEILKGCYRSVIDRSIQKIGNYAFYKCRLPSGVIIPNGVISIGCHAFDGCSMYGIEIPNSVRTIGEYAFANIQFGVHTLTIPQFVKKISKGCFMHSSIENIYLPDSIETIEEEAFSHCHSLKEVDLPSSITIIPDGCFSNSGIEKINFPINLKKIGSRAFYDCYCLKVSPPHIRDISPDPFSSSLKGFVTELDVKPIKIGLFDAEKEFIRKLKKK